MLAYCSETSKSRMISRRYCTYSLTCSLGVVCWFIDSSVLMLLPEGAIDFSRTNKRRPNQIMAASVESEEKSEKLKRMVTKNTLRINIVLKQKKADNSVKTSLISL